VGISGSGAFDFHVTASAEGTNPELGSGYWFNFIATDGGSILDLSVTSEYGSLTLGQSIPPPAPITPNYVVFHNREFEGSSYQVLLDDLCVMVHQWLLIPNPSWITDNFASSQLNSSLWTTNLDIPNSSPDVQSNNGSVTLIEGGILTSTEHFDPTIYTVFISGQVTNWTNRCTGDFFRIVTRSDGMTAMNGIYFALAASSDGTVGMSIGKLNSGTTSQLAAEAGVPIQLSDSFNFFIEDQGTTLSLSYTNLNSGTSSTLSTASNSGQSPSNLISFSNSPGNDCQRTVTMTDITIISSSSAITSGTTGTTSTGTTGTTSTGTTRSSGTTGTSGTTATTGTIGTTGTTDLSSTATTATTATTTIPITITTGSPTTAVSESVVHSISFFVLLLSFLAFC